VNNIKEFIDQLSPHWDEQKRFKSRKKVNEAERDHWARVRKVRPLEPKELELKFWKRLTKGLDYELDGNAKEVLRFLVDYLNGKNDQSKGIYLHGLPGTGKSHMMRTFAYFRNREEIKLHSSGSSDLKLEMDRYKGFEPLERCINAKELFFDDVGTDRNFKVFGNELDPWVEIVTHRERKRQLTFATSNLPFDYLQQVVDTDQEVYHRRIVSRMRSMFHFIHLTGKDKRK
jgi:primosomal protein DnaI